jgi:hypothetical protein
MGETRNGYKILVGMPQVERPLRRPRFRWEDVRMDRREIEWEHEDGFIWLRIGTSGGLQ